jgi:hypothetical protein
MPLIFTEARIISFTEARIVFFHRDYDSFLFLGTVTFRIGL